MTTVLKGLKPTLKGREYWDPETRIVHREHELEAWVQADEGDTEQQVLATLGVPTIGSFWSVGGSSDLQSLCRARDPEQVSPFRWRVTCQFDTQAKPEDPNTAPENRTPEWSWSMETEEMVLTKDPITGKPIVNSVGEPIIVTVPRPIPVLRVERYELSFSPQTMLDFANHVNDAAFYGADPKAALLAGIDDNPVDVDGRKMRRVAYTVKFATPDTWELELLDHGTKHLVGGVARAFVDEQGNPTTGNLNGAGLALAVGEHFLTFNRFDTADFSTLDLGPF